MPRLGEINDVKTLQEIGLHLEKSNIRLSKENAKLRAEVCRLRGGDVDPQMEMELLKEQLAAMQRMVFGESSERRPSGTSDAAEAPKKPRRGHGPKAQPDLPIEEVTHTLEEEDRVCPICGETLTEMGDQAEESEEITVVGVQYKILKHRRRKYRCHCNEHVVSAPGPVKLIPAGRYSVDFAVKVAEDKYLDHFPLERQARAMGRRNLDIDSQTLWDQINALARHLEPAYQALCRQALESDVGYADETVRRNHENKNTSRRWTWWAVSDKISNYRIEKSRSQGAAKRVLE